jgi:hypothetical protein
MTDETQTDETRTDETRTDPADSIDSETDAAWRASETPDASGEGPADGSADSVDEADETDDGDGSVVDTGRVRRYVERAVLAGLLLFALVAAFRFYFAASNALSYWVATPYESAFQAAFNLVVLLVVGAAILRQLQRMR